MMQTLITTVLIILALIYVGKRWLPIKLKHRLLLLCGRPVPATTSSGGCGSCSSCGNCGSSSGAGATAASHGKKIFIVHSK